jgi:hypothetical protein
MAQQIREMQEEMLRMLHAVENFSCAPFEQVFW